MAAYRLSRNAKDDLQLIYVYGVDEFGEAQADEYFWGFFETFQKIANNPLAYQSAEYTRLGYRRCIYHSDTIYFRRLTHSHIYTLCAYLSLVLTFVSRKILVTIDH